MKESELRAMAMEKFHETQNAANSESMKELAQNLFEKYQPQSRKDLYQGELGTYIDNHPQSSALQLAIRRILRNQK